jgi:hypothetical protein
MQFSCIHVAQTRAVAKHDLASAGKSENALRLELKLQITTSGLRSAIGDDGMTR